MPAAIVFVVLVAKSNVVSQGRLKVGSQFTRNTDVRLYVVNVLLLFPEGGKRRLRQVFCNKTSLRCGRGADIFVHLLCNGIRVRT